MWIVEISFPQSGKEIVGGGPFHYSRCFEGDAPRKQCGAFSERIMEMPVLLFGEGIVEVV